MAMRKITKKSHKAVPVQETLTTEEWKAIKDTYAHKNFQWVKMDKIKAAPYNPKGRTNEKSCRSEIYKLIKSIKRIGLGYPVMVDGSFNLIDGHRRTKACQFMGWHEMPYIPMDGSNRHHTYAEVNANAKIISGAEQMGIFISNPDAVPEGTRARLERKEEKYGRPLLKRLVKEGFSHNAIALAEHIAKYVGEDRSPEFVTEIINWLIKNRNSAKIRSFMTTKQRPRVLYDAIKEDRDLAMNYI